jgi:hypothetical protein
MCNVLIGRILQPKMGGNPFYGFYGGLYGGRREKAETLKN